jgi:hypothetical protein
MSGENPDLRVIMLILSYNVVVQISRNIQIGDGILLQHRFAPVSYIPVKVSARFIQRQIKGQTTTATRRQINIIRGRSQLEPSNGMPYFDRMPSC